MTNSHCHSSLEFCHHLTAGLASWRKVFCLCTKRLLTCKEDRKVSFKNYLDKCPPPLLPILFTQLFLNCQPDIDKVLRSFDNVISYHNVASSEDQDIRDGFVYGCILVLRYHCLNNWCLAFSARPGADVDSYLRSLENVKDAIGFFERNNPNSPELSLLVSVNKNSSS